MKRETKRLRALVADDEPLALRNLAQLLEADESIAVIARCESGQEAIQAIRTQQPDVAFLDIEMPESNGFEILEKVGCRVPPAVVFVTAYDEFALRAFEAGALDYILKPFEEKRLRRAIDRVRTVFSTSSEQPAQRIAIRDAGSVFFVLVNDIDWIEAADYYVCVHIDGRTHIVRRSLAQFEAELDPQQFCRIHRSALVNLSRVAALKPNVTGDYDLELRDGKHLRVSRRYRRAVVDKLGLT